MCCVAPLVLHGLAGVAPRTAPAAVVRRTMATSYVEAPRELCRYDDDNIEALLHDIDAVVRPPTPASGLTPQLLSSVEFLALSRQDADADLEAFLRGARSVHVSATGLAPAAMTTDEATPTTPLAVLGAPCSYGDDAAAANVATIKSPYSKKPPFETYDADIDASLRAMEKDPAERPSAGYLWTTQEREMTMADRAELVASMHDFAGYYDLASGTLHRAVSYVDRFLSARKIGGGGSRHQLRILGAAAVFTAAKYEDRSTTRALDADDVAGHAGCTRGKVVAAERELVVALGYCLGGPTAYTFVDHLITRHYGGGRQEEGGAAAVRSLAYHLADLALLDYQCLRFLLSVMAAAAIVLARLALGCAGPWSEEIKVVGYKFEDLTGCMDAIYDMHEHQYMWPGCAQC